MKYFGLVAAFLFFASASNSQATEETVDLEKENAPASTTAHPNGGRQGSGGLSIMGRVDLTSDYGAGNPVGTTNGDSTKYEKLTNNHFFLFLKAKPSERVSFMGEFVGQNFFTVDFEATKSLSISFGKILIPFGDTRYFHHFYGGIAGYGATSGIMLPNIWSAPGFSLGWKWSNMKFDTYVVQTLGQDAGATDPVSINSSSATSNRRQAAGLRSSFSPLDRVGIILSAYHGDYTPSVPLTIGGFDINAEYGAIPWGVLKHLRFSYGVANAWLKTVVQGIDYEKRGDYAVIGTNYLNPVEIRVRYGTYLNDTRAKSQFDVHNFNLGVNFPVDVLRVLLEYQLNYEAANEVENDVARVMVSLDF
ncbi:MAG: hypothetical protein J0L82_18300 [Deltaproteobacteria bacterium]|nr:hypothetical protein [Deltaproteobacteria bacterium]